MNSLRSEPGDRRVETRPLGHVRALDGLRAIAVLLVLGFHAGLPGVFGGRAGVDVFFVLSGFLITSLLLEEHRRTGAVHLGAFYIRRALRLYPALLVAVAGALTLAALKMPVFGASATTLKDTLRGTPFALFYAMNIGRAAGWSQGGFLGHMWSLAIEEQFYLVWPVVVILVLRRRTGPARLGWIALACALTSAALRAGLNAAGFDGEMLFNATFSHVDGIFAGCAFAVLWSQRPDLARRFAHPALTAAAIAVGTGVIVWGRQMNTFGFLLVVVATVLLLAAVLAHPASRLSAALSHPAAVAIGRRSYGIYVYHWPIFLFLGIDTRPAVLALGFGLSFAAAWVSFAVVERPFLAMKQRWGARVDTGPKGRPSQVRPRISLLHATYKRPGGPLEVRDAWLASAVDPESIEYVVSMDADDLATVALTEGLPRLVNPPGEGAVTAVRNWNAAAAAAEGDLLFVIADDLFPPQGWDRALIKTIGCLNPGRTSFAVKVADDPSPGDILLRHPVVSRAFYAKLGLFSPAYRGLYCDNDFTAQAFWRSVILDGRSLQLEHRHPNLTDQAAPSESHNRMNRGEEYERGRAQYLSAWSRWKRNARPRLVPTGCPQKPSHWGLFVTQRRLRGASNVQVVLRGSRKAVSLLCAKYSRVAGACNAHARIHARRLAEIGRRHLILRHLVRRHPELPSFFLVNRAATRYAPLSKTVGDVVTVLARLRRPLPALRAVRVTSTPVKSAGPGFGRLRVLVVDPLLPMYDKAAGSLRLFHILRLLREAGHHVTFLARDGAGQERYGPELEAMGIVVHAGDREPLRQRGVAGEGTSVDLVQILRRGRFDVAWLDFYELAERYLPEIRAEAPSTRIVVDTVDVHWVRQQRQAEIEDDARRRRQARMTRLREEAVYRAADGLVAVTADDERALRRLAPDVPTYILGTVHPSEESVPGMDSRSGLVFVGNFNHPPNVDAALYLIREVMPLVWATHPAMSVTIVGTSPPSGVRQLAGERVTVTGHVSETRPYLDAARVSVAPVRFGAGIKGKVGEALAAGLPVVTTPIGAEGMGLEDGVHVMVSDSAAGLAASIIRLHTDSDLWSRLSEGGRQEVERRYGLDVTRSRLADIMTNVMSRTAFVWVPDWQDEEEIDDVLGFYSATFSPQDPVALLVGLDAGARSPKRAVAALAASLARIGRDPDSIASVAITPFPAGHPEALLCPGAVWLPAPGASARLTVDVAARQPDSNRR